MSFIYSCIIALLWGSNTLLNRSGKSGHSCLGHDLRGKAFSFSSLSLILAVTLLYVASVIEAYSFYIEFIQSIFLVS